MANADNNVPFIGPRSRYEILSTSPTMLKQVLASGTFTGVKPEQVGVPADDLDPVISTGQALWSNLSLGGLFNFVGKPIIVEALSTGPTWNIVLEVAPLSYVVNRPTPNTFPFKLAPGEKLQAVGGSTATVIARWDVLKCI